MRDLPTGHVPTTDLPVLARVAAVDFSPQWPLAGRRPRGRLLSAVSLLAACWVLASGPLAAGGPAPRQVGALGPSRWLAAPIAQAGGSARAVAVSGGHAYLGVGPRVVVLDVGDPAAPRPLGQTEVLPGVVQDLAVDGDVVYAVTGNDWFGGALVAVDMTDATAPMVVGRLDLPQAPSALAVSGGRAFVADGRLRVVDIRDPARLVEGAGMGYSTPVQGIIVAGDVGYAFGAGQVYAMDLSLTTVPGVSSSQSVAGAVSGMAVSGSHVFAVSESGLTVVDVGDPQEIRGLTLTALGTGVAHAVVASGDTAFVAYGSVPPLRGRSFPPRATGGLMALDIRDPRKPVVRGAWDAGGSVYDVALAGNLAYLAMPEVGLQVVDIGVPGQPRPLGAYAGAGVYTALDVDGTHVVVASATHGVTNYRLAADHSLRQTGRLDTNEAATDVALADGAVHLAIARSGLMVANVTRDGELALRGMAATRGLAMSVAAADGHAYVADRSGALLTYRVPETGDPIRVAANLAPRAANAVALGAGYAFVLSSERHSDDAPATLRAFDIGDPENPKLAGSVAVAYTDGLALDGRNAFVWGHDAIERLDVGNHLTSPLPSNLFPAMDQLSAVRPIPGSNAALVSSYDGALGSIDFGQPISGRPARLFGTSLPMADIDLVGDIAYVAALDSGIWAVELIPRGPWQALLPNLSR